ncbi:DUF4917 family protein [Klebsiella oxytoca]|nr:DUF4917 family protein [Klebsiella oxytoca]
MTYKIYEWSELRGFYSRGALLIGNGASIAIDSRFNYESLLKYAEKSELLTHDINMLFDFFETSDFELILRLVWQASNVNRSLHINDDKTHAAYVRVRECLIKAVRAIHPQHYEIAQHIPNIYGFIKNFNTVISLNYDLILYWAVMYGNEISDYHTLKDCFIHGKFDSNWERLRLPLYMHKTVTLIFYPHGNLILARDKVESEFKLSSYGECLLEDILTEWQSENCIPLFVCEGGSQQKIKAIEGSNYLSVIYREVYKKIGDKLVIYGWGMWEQDEYIVKRIAQSGVKHIAVSVYGNNQEYCKRIINTINKLYPPGGIAIDFFSCDSPGAWNN